MVRTLVFYSIDPSLSPTETNRFSTKLFEKIEKQLKEASIKIILKPEALSIAG